MHRTSWVEEVGDSGTHPFCIVRIRVSISVCHRLVWHVPTEWQSQSLQLEKANRAILFLQRRGGGLTRTVYERNKWLIQCILIPIMWGQIPATEGRYFNLQGLWYNEGDLGMCPANV